MRTGWTRGRAAASGAPPRVTSLLTGGKGCGVSLARARANTPMLSAAAKSNSTLEI